MKRLLLALTLLAAAAQIVQAAERPKIGLVLSGGGARGLAHIGVLRVLEALKVPVDIIVGTSMGAVVGGAYAAGRSTDELEQLVREADWAEILADRPAREHLSLRRREDDQLLPSRIEFGISATQGAILPSGAAGNSQLEATLAALLPVAQAETPLRQLPIPFRAVATDLLSGAMLDQADTPLFQALRASMAVPGVFTPLRHKGRPLVDGGLVRNLPVDLARALGAEVIIAVNVGTPLLEDREITSAVAVANQMLQILTEQNVQRSLRELTARDIVIDPDLGGMGFMDFGRAAEAIANGRRSAMAAAARLQQLSDASAFARLQARRLAEPDLPLPALPLASLSLVGAERVNPEALRAELDLKPGRPARRADIERAVEQLHGTGDFERVEVQIDDAAGLRHVELSLTEAEWARSRLRLGLELYSNFADANRYSLVAMHVADWLNAAGGELRTLGRIGSTRGLSSEFFQPLGPGSPWSLAASISYEADSNDVFYQGQRALRVSSSLGAVQLALGRRIAGLGDVRLGQGWLRAQAEVIIPAPPTGGTQTGRYSQQFIELRTDTLDSLAFPSRGNAMSARIEWLHPRSGQTLINATALGLMAFRLGDWAGQVYAEAGHAGQGQARSLGGYLRLSGTADASIRGENMALARLVMARRIGQMPVGLGGAVRVGFSIETGAVGAGRGLRLANLPSSGWRRAGSSFLSVDTRFGPFYLAVGATQGGDTAAYLLLGPTW